MQNPQIRKLAIKLRKNYRVTQSWRGTSAECKVLTEDGRVNPGLAKRIARDGYQPTDEVIERLIQHGAIEGKHKRQCKLIYDMTTNELLNAFINRQPMPKVAPSFKKAFKQLGWKNVRVGAR